jgi:hypothetical protein
MTQRSARNDITRVFRAAARLVQNAAIERLAKKDARVSCSENMKMGNSSTDRKPRGAKKQEINPGKVGVDYF